MFFAATAACAYRGGIRMGKARLLKILGLKRKHRIFISVILSIVLVFGNLVGFKRAVAMEGTETA